MTQILRDQMRRQRPCFSVYLQKLHHATLKQIGTFIDIILSPARKLVFLRESFTVNKELGRISITFKGARLGIKNFLIAKVNLRPKLNGGVSILNCNILICSLVAA